MIVSDLDDTLLDRQGRISPRNEEAIRRAVAKGAKVTLATGRMAKTSRKYARELALDVPIITYHGALVEQALSGEVLYRKVIPTELAAEILEYLAKRNIYNLVFLKDEVFAQKTNTYSEDYGKMIGFEVKETDIGKLLGHETEGFEKILCIGEPEKLSLLRVELGKKYASRLYFTSSRDYYLDILHEGVNKWIALRALADQWQIRTEEIMAIGDSLNDIEMISSAGIGVAVENAIPQIKEIADYITSSNIEDGVAKAIERFVLNE